jgi:hypothetical protein
LAIEVTDALDREATKYELKPNSKPQTTFLGLPHSFFEAGYGGTAGTGKTFALVTLPLFKGCHKIRGFYGKIWRRSFPQIQESLEPESKKWYPRFGFSYNESDHTWKNRETKAEIAFGFLDKEKDALKHDSAQYHYLGFEELTQFTKFMYTYLLHRCRSDISGWTAICRNAATPGDIGNTWYRRHFVEPAPEGYRTIEGDFHGKIVKRIFIRAHKDDNVDLLRQDPTYYDRLNMLPEALRKAKLYGDFWAFQGQVFEEFRTFHIDGEPDNALHVIDSHPDFRFIPEYGWVPPDWWPKIIAIDWGFRHSTWVGWGTVSPQGELIIYREYVCNFTAIKIWASKVKRLSQFDNNIVKIVCDPSAWFDVGLDKNIADQIAETTGWTIEKAVNDRIGGKQLLHELFRWKARGPKFEIDTSKFDPDYAQKLLRWKGLEAYREYVNLFVPDSTDEFLPKFKCFDTCPALIDAVQACIYDEGEGNNRQRAEDVKKQDGDDPYDGVRYLAQEYKAFVEGVNSEWLQRCDASKALSDFHKTGDYLTFDNRMSAIEESQAGPEPISGFVRPRKHGRVVLH